MADYVKSRHARDAACVATQEAASAAAAAAAARGKRGKAKKAREKYGDQDEEDRELLLGFLGSAGASLPEPWPERSRIQGGDDFVPHLVCLHKFAVLPGVQSEVTSRSKLEGKLGGK